MAQASDGAIRVQASFLFGSAHDGYEAVLEEEHDFEVADGYEAVSSLKKPFGAFKTTQNNSQTHLPIPTNVSSASGTG